MNAYSAEGIKPTEAIVCIYPRLSPSFMCSVVQVIAV